MTGLLPQSNALAEASPESLTDLMSRDPQGYAKLDRDRITEFYRAQRKRFAEADQEAAATGKRVALPRSPKAPLPSVSDANPEDLGL